MKSRSLLISVICILVLVLNANAQEKPEEIYVQAKNALNNDDYDLTIQLLTKYLTLETPRKEKLDAIHSVIDWCTLYLKKGQIYHRIEILGAFENHFEYYYKETPFGAKMKKNKKQLPNN